MDDIAEKISSILNDPQSMEQIKNIAGMLGVQESIPEKPPASQPDLSSFLQFAPLLNMVKSNDETICFLMALRPLLSDARKRKLDEAIKILRIIKLFPLLKNTGILSSLF